MSQDSDDEAHDPQTKSIGEMQKEDLLSLLNILRLMDPGKFELALCLSSSLRQSVPSMMSLSPPPRDSISLLSLESSIRLWQQYELLLQSQNVLMSLGSSGFPNSTLPHPYNLNPVITPTISSSLLYHPQLFGLLHHESVNPSLTHATTAPTAAMQRDFAPRN